MPRLIYRAYARPVRGLAQRHNFPEGEKRFHGNQSHCDED